MRPRLHNATVEVSSGANDRGSRLHRCLQKGTSACKRKVQYEFKSSSQYRRHDARQLIDLRRQPRYQHTHQTEGRKADTECGQGDEVVLEPFDAGRSRVLRSLKVQ